MSDTDQPISVEKVLACPYKIINMLGVVRTSQQ
jgi:hypothetical protein